jgi:hypothetical protein
MDGGSLACHETPDFGDDGSELDGYRPWPRCAASVVRCA